MAVDSKSAKKAITKLRKENLSVHGEIACAVLEVFIKQKERKENGKTS